MRRLMLVFLAMILTACGAGQPFIPSAPSPTPDPCSPGQVDATFHDFQDMAGRFDDANKLANSTPRMSLPSVISQLQEIRRDMQSLEMPECAQPVQEAVIVWMDAIIDVYITFLDPDVSDTTMGVKDRAASAAFNDYERVYQDMLEGAAP